MQTIQEVVIKTIQHTCKTRYGYVYIEEVASRANLSISDVLNSAKELEAEGKPSYFTRCRVW